MRLHIPAIIAVLVLVSVTIGAVVALILYDPLLQSAAEEGIHRVPDVQVSSTVGTTIHVQEGETVRVPIQITNNGPITAEGVSVSIRSVSEGWSVTWWNEGQDTVWIGNLEDGESSTVTLEIYRAQVNAEAGSAQVWVGYMGTGETYSVVILPAEGV